MSDVRHTATNGLFSDQLETTSDPVHFYVEYLKTADNQKPQPSLRCPETLDWMKVILISVGSGCGLFAAGFITYFVVVNVKDYRELREFMKNQKETWRPENVVEPDLKKSMTKKKKSLRNRMSVKFSKK